MGFLQDLSPLGDKHQKYTNFGIIDFEAQAWIEYVCAGVYDAIRGFEVFDYNEDFEEIFEYLFETAEEVGVYFAHFGGKYDFLFLLDYLFTQNKFTFVSAIPRGSLILTFEVEYDGKKLKFWDSSA